MEIIKQTWSWEEASSVIYLLIGIIINSLSIIIINYFKEKSKRTTLIRLEKFKMYKNIKFKAYEDLNEFISSAFLLYDPTENPEEGFISVMKKVYFNKVKIHYYYYTKEVKENLKILEGQYRCVGNPDFTPAISFEKFYRTEYLKILNELNKTVEDIFDELDKN